MSEHIELMIVRRGQPRTDLVDPDRPIAARGTPAGRELGRTQRPMRTREGEGRSDDCEG